MSHQTKPIWRAVGYALFAASTWVHSGNRSTAEYRLMAKRHYRSCTSVKLGLHTAVEDLDRSE